MTSAKLLEARGLAARRGERLLFEGVDFTLPAGQVLWLRGTNGRGKTTMLRVLAGLAPAAAGSVLVAGTGLREGGAAAREHLAYVAHANALKEDLPAVQALRFLAGLRGHPPSPQALAAALARLGVSRQAALPVRVLSQGQRRRVALARLALPGAPRLWLLDEPLDALDEAGVAALLALLREHTEGGGAVMLTSHQALPPGVASRELDLDACGPKSGRGRP